MICLLALIILAFLGIFSAKYRGYAKEAFNCVFRRMTLRKCNTAFDKKIKMRVSAKLMKRNKAAAGFVFKHFEAIGLVFTILFIASIAYSAVGLYNLAAFGSCDPHSGQCIFAPGEISCGSEMCKLQGCECETIGCEAPFFAACDGNCDCNENICG